MAPKEGLGPQEEEWEPTEKVREHKEEGLDHWKEWWKHGGRDGNPAVGMTTLG